MSVIAEEARPYTIRANLVWFAAAYTVIVIAVAALAWGLEFVNIQLPGVGIGVATFLGAVSAAGSHYARRVDGAWERGERSNLALGYTIVSLLVSFAIVAIFLGIAAAMGLLGEIASQLPAMDQFWFIVVGALIFISALNYVLARLLLGGIAKRFVPSSPDLNRTMD